MTIWKFHLDVRDEQDVAMPIGAEILTVQVQCAQPFIWAKVDPDKGSETRVIYTRGTGHPLSGDEGRHIGTYQLQNGGLVFHVFEARA